MTALPTKLPPTPMSESSAGSQLPQALADPSPTSDAPAEPFSPASFDVTPIHDVQESPPAAAMEVSGPTVAAWRLADAKLLLCAEALTDLEATRIASENRLRALQQDYGLTEGPEITAQADLVGAIGKLEHQAELDLKRALRTHPLGPWVKATQGVGEKQGARLIAAIGDPAWHSRDERPRLVSELWAYAGLHVLHPGQRGAETPDTYAGVQPDVHLGQTHAAEPNASCAGMDQTSASQICAGGVAPRRQRGQKANWNSAVKMRAYLVAESCIKKRDSPYRPVYDQGREKYLDAVHNHPCVRCGPSGHPAQPGNPLSAGHQHARAMRLVMKALLRDLWAEARRLHEEDT